MTHVAFPGPETPAGASRITEASHLRSSAHPPVFLHCGWRTRGTWIWNRFREMRGVAGYYEPLGEALASLRPGTVDALTADSWPSGHMGLSRPYSDEYRPLLNTGRPGVRYYQTRFATGDFFARPGTGLPDLEHYLRTLLNTARDRGEQPVLKFCGSVGRIGWMRQHFPDAAHIVVMRDPFTQFMSSARLFIGTGNAFFLAMPLALLAMHQDQPLVRLCTRHLGLELPDKARCRTPDAARSACEISLRNTTSEVWYRGFLAFWVTAAALLPDTADLVIDSEALANSGSYRFECEIELARLTGRMVEFGDADCSGDIERQDVPRPVRSGILRAHAGAEAFLADQLGPLWADTPGMGFVATLLADARSRAMGSPVTRGEWHPAIPSLHEGDRNVAAALLSAEIRAEWAGRELGAVLASHSWRLTAPLRWLRRALS
jgi:hypothetical protein